MKHFLKIAMPLALAMVLAACAVPAPQPESTASTPKASAAPVLTAQVLAGSVWSAGFIDGVGAARGNWPQLRWVGTDRVAGSGGCNNFVGSAVLEQDSLRFGSLAATGKLCMTEPGGQEDKFFMALELTRKARLEGTQLWLLDASGKPLVKLERLN
ncbi:META domain-containing protein [Rhodoferax saidenbachensis]|uniref:META domain-containing protein n=1 Tax=Rhodoferax saidenbachensis TaxID=1484693 RepID=A0A1P8KCI3_9BURK|nr:META domain-containing protein [Rhodoferax saidenbachensis]APW43721.1 META domain-containing protein [Rhodoferax saidenbachensis]